MEKWSDNTESVRTSCPTVTQPHTACLCSVNSNTADLRSTGPWATFVCLSVSVVFEAEKAMATHSSVLAWRIPGTGEPDGLPSLGLHRVGHNWSDLVPGASMRNSACGKGHEEGGLAYAKAGWSLRIPPGNSRASTPKPRVCLLSALCFHLHLWLYGGLSPTTSLWKKS